MTAPDSSAAWQKASATLINATLAGTAAMPLGLAWGFDAWRVSALAICLLIGLTGRHRCIGMRVMGLHQNRPASVRYVLLYTLGFSTSLFWLVVPGDLLALNLSAQAVCLRRTGMTVHGWLAGVYTLRGDRGLA